MILNIALVMNTMLNTPIMMVRIFFLAKKHAKEEGKSDLV
tara:strand:+ start:543 stop:662 length:120 start_codon:yes stop_codon:yes gene_type:complete